MRIIGRPLAIDAAALRQVLDTRALVAARTLAGGPAPEPMRVQLETATERCDQAAGAVSERRRAIADAEAALFARARELASGGPTRV
jgi:argininosuccinate lyase